MQEPISYPHTAQQDHTDHYFGTAISDPYRWLEDDRSAETADWVQRQNEVTQRYLSAIPYRKKIHSRLTELSDYKRESAPRRAGEWLVFSRNNGLDNQAVVYLQKGLGGEESVLIDPNKLSADGTVALQASAFSKNQQYFAYSVAAAGSDWQEIFILDMESRQVLSDKIEYVKFSGIKWVGDSGFFYSGYDKPDENKSKYSATTEYQKVYFHQIGTPQAADRLVYEDPEHPLRYVSADLTEDERFLILYIAEGTDGVEIKVQDRACDPETSFRTIVPGFATNAAVIDHIDGQLLLQTNLDAPRFKLVMLDPDNPGPEHWQTVIPEAAEALTDLSTGGGKLFAAYLKDAVTVVHQYSRQGQFEHQVALPGPGTAAGFGCKAHEEDFFYTFTSFTHPATIFRYDIRTGISTLYREPALDFAFQDYETRQVFCTSKDGTRVPLFVTHKKGLSMDGNNPTLLYGYGGFNISLTPAFSSTNLVWLEQGGIYVVANLRGGAEYGEEWHQAGMLDRKQNVFDDFIAAAEHLVAMNYTRPEKLAIKGGSNGGLLVGACMTQRPDLFAAAIPQVGVLDMLRYHLFTVGWGWVVEYGSSDNENEFRNLLRYSPLHNLKTGTCYPATLITTADHDDRVVPAHSFKFTAALQQVQGCSAPVLIRIDVKAGHGAGKPTAKVLDEQADVWSFIFKNLNVTWTDGND